MIKHYIESDNQDEIRAYLHQHDELVPDADMIQLDNGAYQQSVRIEYHDGILRGDDAKRVWEDINRMPTEKSKRGAEKLAKMFEGVIKW